VKWLLNEREVAFESESRAECVVSHMDESVVAHTCRRQVTHVNASYHMYEFVISHEWMSLIHMCDMTPSHVRHDIFARVT